MLMNVCLVMLAYHRQVYCLSVQVSNPMVCHSCQLSGRYQQQLYGDRECEKGSKGVRQDVSEGDYKPSWGLHRVSNCSAE